MEEFKPEAVVKRILELCEQGNIAFNALETCFRSLAVYDLHLAQRNEQNSSVVSIKKLCDGLEISIREFFDSDLFDGLEQKIK